VSILSFGENKHNNMANTHCLVDEIAMVVNRIGYIPIHKTVIQE